MFNDRKAAPTKPVAGRGGPLEFRVWCRKDAESDLPWQCSAAFTYLQEALDYVAYLQDRGCDCVFQSPADCRGVKATDRRVVYKPAAVA